MGTDKEPLTPEDGTIYTADGQRVDYINDISDLLWRFDDAKGEWALDNIPQGIGVMVCSDQSTQIVRRARKNKTPTEIPYSTWRRIAGRLGDMHAKKGELHA